MTNLLSNSAGFFFCLIICLIIAALWAKNKRMDSGWGFFFLFFFGFIPGAVLVSMSPSKKKLKNLKNGYYGMDTIIGVIAGVVSIGAAYMGIKSFTTPFYTEDEKLRRAFIYLGAVIGFAGLSFYMFSRFKRHERIYHELNKIESESPESNTNQPL